MHQPARHEPVERRLLRRADEKVRKRHRRHADAAVECLLLRLKPARQMVGQAGADRQAAIVTAGMGRPQLLFEHRQDRVAMQRRGEAQGQEPARPQIEPGLETAIVDLYLGVAAEAVGAHGDRLDHGTKASDDRALGIEPRAAFFEYGYVGRRAADIGDDRVVQAGQIASADEARGRSGEDRLDRAQPRFGGRDQGTVAAHHHHRHVDAAGLEEILAGTDQPVDHRDEARIQKRRQRPARAAELGGKLMAAGDRQVRDLADAIAHALLVVRVAHGEITGDREGRHLGAEVRKRFVERTHVERRFAAMDVVAAGKEKNGIGPERFLKTVALQVFRTEADHDQASTAALAFDQRIGGKRRRERHEADRRNRYPRLREHRFHGA